MSGKSTLASPRFLSIDEALTLHETAILQHGGAMGLRDRGALDSALAQAPQAFGGAFVHEFPFEMAAAYVFHLSKNHPFVDGNKRVAFSACVAFLRMNGWSLEADQIEAEGFVLDVVAGFRDKQAAAQWLADRAKQRPSIELREFFATLNYAELAETFHSIAISPQPEVRATNREAFAAIPAIAHAWGGAADARAGGDTASAAILEQHAIFLTALFRIAEQQGYEW